MARRAHLSPTRGPSPDARPARTLSYAGVVSIAAPARPLRYHFSGIAGAGMNPLARLMRARGHTVQGSDRALDQGKSGDLAELLRGLGITLLPQDGAAVTPQLDRFIYSTAVEADTPEMRAARALGIERVARPALLAEVVNAGRPGVAIAGTSGKSTITGMVTWLTREARLPATALGGAALVGEGVSGCFLAGPDAAPVAAEACESDGTLTGYAPALGVIHNISRDHGEVDALRPQFEAFARSARRLLVNAACPEAFAVGRAQHVLYLLSRHRWALERRQQIENRLQVGAFDVQHDADSALGLDGRAEQQRHVLDFGALPLVLEDRRIDDQLRVRFEHRVDHPQAICAQR